MERAEWSEAMTKACRMMNDNPGQIESRYLELAIQSRPKGESGLRAAGLARSMSNRVWAVFYSPSSGMIFVRVSPNGEQHETYTKAFELMETMQ